VQGNLVQPTLDSFLKALPFDIFEQKAIAVGLSGGPDSSALVKALSEWTQENRGPEVCAVIVDHKLRPESGKEAQGVKDRAGAWPGVSAEILSWNGGRDVTSRKQELARQARYDLFAEFCTNKDIKALFLAHHRDDQAETVLFRLAKGSGLKGLGGMDPMQERGGLFILRPFLDIPKADLTAFCEDRDIAFVKDPSNDDLSQARPRLRAAKESLEKEGLSDERLAQTALRLRRAESALSFYAEQAYTICRRAAGENKIELDKEALATVPEEMIIRILAKALEALGEGGDYGPRTNKLESLCEDLIHQPQFRKRTLGGVIIERDDVMRRIVITRESA